MSRHRKPRGCWKVAQDVNGLDDQAITLFCSSCKSVFLPGINCVVRTLTKSRKKHEFRKKKITEKNWISMGMIANISIKAWFIHALCAAIVKQSVSLYQQRLTRKRKATKIGKKK